jgi:hypothetical protein
MLILWALAVLFAAAQPAQGQTLAGSEEKPKATEDGTEAQPPASRDTQSKPFPLPFLAEEARKRGIDLPLPFGFGLVYYHLERDIRITDVWVGRNGASPASVSQFANLGSTATTDNVNLKFDVWLLPFLNVYAIAGYVWNSSDTRIDVTLPPLTPVGQPRRFQMTVPTEMTGTVAGLGLTLAGGYGPFFMALDVNAVKANLGFDERFHGVITSARAGWSGEVGSRPLRTWVNITRWDTYDTVKGTVADPDGGTLAFEVDQGPAYPYTYGVGVSYSPRKWFDVAVDTGTDFHGGWYVAVVPVVRL